VFCDVALILLDKVLGWHLVDLGEHHFKRHSDQGILIRLQNEQSYFEYSFPPILHTSTAISYHDKIVPDPFQLPLGVSLRLVLQALGENSDEERAAIETTVHVFILF
jgi:hypothetical protein